MEENVSPCLTVYSPEVGAGLCVGAGVDGVVGADGAGACVPLVVESVPVVPLGVVVPGLPQGIWSCGLPTAVRASEAPPARFAGSSAKGSGTAGAGFCVTPGVVAIRDGDMTPVFRM